MVRQPLIRPRGCTCRKSTTVSLGRCATLFLLLTGTLAGVTACASPEASSPEQAAVRLYAMIDALGLRSIPDSLELRALRPFIADSLAGSLADAFRYRSEAARYDAANRPGWLEGDPFSSLAEGHNGGHPDTTLLERDTALVVMAFSSSDYEPPVSWRDTVVVTRQGGRYVVADVRYGAAWEFGFTGRLLDMLGAPPAPAPAITHTDSTGGFRL